MFRKLLKYELKAIGKWYLALSSLILLISLGASLFVRMTNLRNPEVAATVFALAIIAFAILTTALFIISLIIIIRRFYVNIFGQEGYLTLTLPVKVHQLILSKLVAASLITLINYFVLALSLFLIFVVSAFPEIQGDLKVAFNQGSPLEWSNWYWGLVLLFIGIISNIMSLYCAIAIGQLFRNHRIIAAVLSYFILLIVTSLGASLLNASLDGLGLLAEHSLIINAIFNCIYILGAYLVTHHIIKDKLDLQ